MTVRLIPLADPDGWAVALRRVAHGPAHTHWYCSALAADEDDIVLFEYSEGDQGAVCPLRLRRYRDSVDIATPYGFGGFAMRGDGEALPAAFREFATAQGWVCGYLALHPVFPHPFGAADGLEPGRTVYVLDLSASEDRLFAFMHGTHRYEIRRESDRLASVVTDTQELADPLVVLYAETLARVDAAATYRFAEATLRAWLNSPGCLALALGRPPRAVVLCLYTADVADYFINASTPDGRADTRILLWAAMLELKRRGVRYLNVGGGVSEGDALDAFKRRFGGRGYRAPVLKQVYLRERFSMNCRLAGVAEAATGFFPPYRSSR